MTQVLARSVFAALALILSFGACAADKVSRGDKKFMMSAAMDSVTEVELGKVVQQNAASEDVKKFGQRMVDDHTKANQELEPIAARLGVTLPTAPKGKHARMIKSLSKKTGAEFDKAYVNDMVKDHKKAVKLFQKKFRKADSDELRQFAAKTLPTLREHLKMARDLQAGMKKNAKKS